MVVLIDILESILKYKSNPQIDPLTILSQVESLLLSHLKDVSKDISVMGENEIPQQVRSAMKGVSGGAAKVQTPRQT